MSSFKGLLAVPWSRFVMKPYILCTVSFLCQIQDIIRMPHLLTIFRISEDNHGDVDVAILQALLKGKDLVLPKMLSTRLERLQACNTASS